MFIAKDQVPPAKFHLVAELRDRKASQYQIGGWVIETVCHMEITLRVEPVLAGLDDRLVKIESTWFGSPQCGKCGSVRYWRERSDRPAKRHCGGCQKSLASTQDAAEFLCPDCNRLLMNLVGQASRSR
jgi:predicted RNA-binding Zn-ribbon protein involved in translation (DUF1610 family)